MTEKIEIPEPYTFFKANKLNIAVEITAYSYSQAAKQLANLVFTSIDRIGIDWLLISPKDCDRTIDK